MHTETDNSNTDTSTSYYNAIHVIHWKYFPRQNVQSVAVAGAHGTALSFPGASSQTTMAIVLSQ